MLIKASKMSLIGVIKFIRWCSMKKFAIIILILLIIIATTEYMKTPIEEATYEQLVEVDSIGPALADAILSSSPTSLDSLRFDGDRNMGVKYIGKERLKELKKHFR